MNNDAEFVQKRIEELGGKLLSSVKKEVAELHTHLFESEEIHAIACGLMETSTWLITVTNKRILFTYSGMLGKNQKMDLALSQIRSVSVKNGMLLSELLIETGGETKK